MKNKIKKINLFLPIIFGICSLFFINYVKAYDSPIGIPTPSFGIDESHMMYEGQRFDFDGDIILEEGEEYKDAGNGPYTHYIDNSSGACSDELNVYGTVITPRCTIPEVILAGSVIELHGGPYISVNIFDVHGAAQYPIFIRGYSTLEKTIINGYNVNQSRSSISVQRSSYLIIENFLLDGSALTGTWEDRNSSLNVGDNSHYISVRNMEVTDYPAPDLCGDEACWYASLLSVAGDINNTTSNIVFYNNYIHNNADIIWPPTYELGRHGFMVLQSSEDIWILNNHITRSGDDGVQIYWKEGYVDGPPAHHIYIGDNEIHNMGENGLDIKQSADVILSENNLYNFTKSDQLGAGSDGAALVFNGDDFPTYGFSSTRLWALNNEIYNSNVGIRSEASGEVHILGNNIHNIVRYPIYDPPISYMSSGCAVETKTASYLTIANNTLDSVDGGIYLVSSLTSEYDISNNIISRLNEATGHALYNNSGSINTYNNLTYIDNENITPFKKIVCLDCMVVDPLYVASDNYRLQEYSPAIDSGRVVDAYAIFLNLYGINIARDITKVSRPQNSLWDIGAYEYDTTSPPDIVAPSYPTNLSVL